MFKQFLSCNIDPVLHMYLAAASIKSSTMRSAITAAS